MPISHDHIIIGGESCRFISDFGRPDDFYAEAGWRLKKMYIAADFNLNSK
jgi:hypothetical protein